MTHSNRGKRPGVAPTGIAGPCHPTIQWGVPASVADALATLGWSPIGSWRGAMPRQVDALINQDQWVHLSRPPPPRDRLHITVGTP